MGGTMSEPEQSKKPPEESLSVRQAFNLISDTATGPNVHLKDNLYQGLAILICLILGALIGFLTVKDRGLGAVLGGGIGLVTGLFGSGIFLMIYRAIRHMRGKHD
jgi:hypothetical protein